MSHLTNTANFHRAVLLVIAALLLVGAAQAQTTAFTYQGRLNDTGTPANTSYDFQFKLFDALTGGNQIGVNALNGVTVTNGAFSVTLDFGAAAFPGATRFLEISVRLSGSGTFTTLAPRRALNSVPYAVKSLSAASADALSGACVSCVADAQIASVAGSKISGAIPAAGIPDLAASYIKNTITQQANSNFSVSGNGTAGGTLSGAVVNATTQFNLGSVGILRLGGGPNDLFIGLNAGSSSSSVGSNTLIGNETGQALTIGTDNTFAGWRAGRFTTSGVENTFLGVGAGELNTSGKVNTFVGRSAGRSNTTGEVNTFLGHEAGFSNTIGGINTFAGWRSGRANVNGSENAFFGVGAGESNTAGSVNTFLGRGAGSSNTTGGGNTFVGTYSGNQNTTGTSNTTVGFSANILPGLSNATAVGALARADCSNCLVLGSVNGINGATANLNVGIGTTAPTRTLDVRSSIGNAVIQAKSSVSSAQLFLDRPSVSGNSSQVAFRTNDVTDFFIGTAQGLAGVSDFSIFDVGINANVLTVVKSSGSVGIGTDTPDQRLTVNGNASKAVGGTTWAVFSDERLKNIKGHFTPGLSALMQLQPIRFEYKSDNALGLKGDSEAVGFSAQAVEKVLPEAVSRNERGYLQLNSDPILWTMLNAIKEQQAQLQSLRLVNEALKADKDQQIDSLQKQNATLLEQGEALKKANAAIEARLAALEKLIQPAAKTKQ